MTRIPKMQFHKASGQAKVRIDGKDHYLGRHGAPKAEAKYKRLIAELCLTGRVADDDTAVTVDEVLASAWQWVEKHYRKDGNPTSEVLSYKRAFSFVRRLYGDTPANFFGPRALKHIREELVAAGFVRRSVNKHRLLGSLDGHT
ncbi:MAG: hypothetical protein ACYTHJ_11935 [Planctomycetota bacterium]|jgi:hypothetical protein